MKFNPFSSPPLVGVDIQPHEARLVQLRKTSKGFLVERAAIVEMPDKVFADGKIKDWDKLRLVLANSVREHKLTGIATAINLPTNLVRIQHIKIPTGIPDAAVEEEIKVQVERDFPGLGDSLYIDFSITSAEESGYSDVFSVVTRQEYVSQYIQCINSIGLKTKIVDVDGYALKRIFKFDSISPPEEVYALACKINHSATLCISAGPEIIFQQMFAAYAIDEFLLQLKKRIQIFLAAFPGKLITNLAVYGNYPQIKIKMEEFDSDGAVKIHYPNPFASFLFSPDINHEIDKEKLLVACGSAMREVPKW